MYRPYSFAWLCKCHCASATSSSSLLWRTRAILLKHSMAILSCQLGLNRAYRAGLDFWVGTCIAAIFVFFVVCHRAQDPPRKNVVDSIKMCKSASSNDWIAMPAIAVSKRLRWRPHGPITGVSHNPPFDNRIVWFLFSFFLTFVLAWSGHLYALHHSFAALLLVAEWQRFSFWRSSTKQILLYFVSVHLRQSPKIQQAERQEVTP